MLLRGQEDKDRDVTIGFITEVIGNMYSYHIVSLSLYHVPDIEYAQNKCSLIICGEEGRKKGREGQRQERKERRKEEGEKGGREGWINKLIMINCILLAWTKTDTCFCETLVRE